jgi:hypothetical protein
MESPHASRRLAARARRQSAGGMRWTRATATGARVAAGAFSLTGAAGRRMMGAQLGRSP